jgi:hypothetical protein
MKTLVLTLIGMLAQPALAQEKLPPHQKPMTPGSYEYQFGQLLVLAHGTSAEESRQQLLAQGVEPEVANKLAPHIQTGMEEMNAVSERYRKQVCDQKATIDRETYARLMEERDAATHAVEKKIVEGVAPLIGAEQNARLEAIKSTKRVGGVSVDVGAAIRDPSFPVQESLAQMCRDR